MARMTSVEKWFVNSRFFDVWREHSLRTLLKSIPIIQGEILEIGSGKGTTTRVLAETFQDASVVGVEFDSSQVALAQQCTARGSKTKVIEGNAANLTFVHSSFEAVFAFLTFHHISNWKRAISECSRVLKPQGLLIVEDLALKPWQSLKHFFLPAQGIFSREEFVNELRKKHLSITTVSGSWRFTIIARKIKL